ncbi:MAG: hypothetical protein KJZ69_04495 [Phycisphaerales bacterium]|nr:hypothetical protein [Phycisphaerales bacterium]
MTRSRYQQLRFFKQRFSIFVMLPVATGSLVLVLLFHPSSAGDPTSRRQT